MAAAGFRAARAAALAVTLAALPLALDGPAAHAPAAAKPYKALGTEPFWSLEMGRRWLVFDSMDGPEIRQKMPRARKTRYGHVYWTRRISVAIIRGQDCSDGMSDFIYRDDVTVTVDGTRFRGCGGPRTLAKGGSRP